MHSLKKKKQTVEKKHNQWNNNNKQREKAILSHKIPPYTYKLNFSLDIQFLSETPDFSTPVNP